MNRICMLGTILCATGVAMAGPDLICSEVTSATSFGFVDGKVAYSFGTTLCNIGDSPVSYVPTTNQHPLISQSIYRLKDHRIEQIGIGFVRHTTIPLPGNACGLGCTPGALDELGVGCSDTNASAVNGAQSMMSPRSEVNAYTGEYPYPPTSFGQTGDAIYKRVQVELGDVSDPDALYFVETQVIVPGETGADARNNNVSYRQVVFTPATATASLVGPTFSQQPAIYAWRDHGNGIGMPDPSVLISSANVPDSGLVYVGSRATHIDADGDYRYDYAIMNLNADQPIAWIEQSAGANGDAHEATFVSPMYHDDLDGLIDAQAWSSDLLSCDTLLYRQAVGFPDDPDANTIRWGTAYSFSFRTVTEPYADQENGIRLGFGVASNDGMPYFFSANAYFPTPGDLFVCAADLNNDGELNFFDVSLFVQGYNSGNDYNGDGQTNFFDVSQFVADYNECCLP